MPGANLASQDECPTEDVLLLFSSGAHASLDLPPVEQHLSTCRTCTSLLADIWGRTAFAGRYRLLETVGAGGGGVVYSAFDEALQRTVALKLLFRRSTSQDLKREAQALAQLSHSNVVTVYDAGVFDDRPFITMQLVEGESLRSWLHRERRTTRAIAGVLCDTARGLQAVHAAGLLHRDVKPENVLVATDGSAKLTDLGLSTLGGDSFAGKVAGTPAYMAPEQQRGEVLDARADVYSFCLTAKEALQGRRIPRQLSRLLDAGSRLERERRPPNMDEITAALEGLAHKSMRRRLLLLCAVGVAVLAGGGRVALGLRTCRDGAQALEAAYADTRTVLAARYANVPGLQHGLRLLDAFVAQWTERHSATCFWGSTDQRVCFRQTLQQLSHRGRFLVEHSELNAASVLAIVDTLPKPATCLAGHAFIANGDAITGPQHEAFEDARLLLESGQYADALRSLVQLLSRPDLQASSGLRASVWLARAQAERYVDRAAVDASCFEAKLAAEATQSDELRAEVAVECVHYLSVTRQQTNAERLVRELGMLMARLPSTPEHQAAYELSQFYVEGHIDPQRALAHLRRVIELQDVLALSRPRLLVSAWTNLCLLTPATDSDSWSICQQARQTLEALVGLDADPLAGVDLQLGAIALERGQIEEALVASSRAYTRLMEVFKGNIQFDMAYAHVRVLVAAGRENDALAVLEASKATGWSSEQQARVDALVRQMHSK